MAGSDVRDDVERAFSSKQRPTVHIEDVLKGAAIFGGGAIAGRYLGKAILRGMAKRNLAKTAMKEFKRGQDVYNMVPPDSPSRFRKGTK